MNNPQEKRIRDWMTSDPVTVPSSMTLPDAYWLMIENDIRRLLVIDHGQLVGIVMMGDLRSSFRTEIIAINPLKVNEILSKMPVRELMSKEPITISPMANVLETAQTMLDRKISTLPVVESGKLVGIITESDLFRVLVDICRELEVEEGGKVEKKASTGKSK